MKKIVVMIGMGILSLSALHAQQDSTLNRTVVVENEYNPTVMDASKINVMPKMNEPKATKKNIDYATSLRPVSAWDYQVMSPVVRDWQTGGAYRGYLHAGYGNNGNVDLGVGYLWNISEKDRLNISASLDGWNGELKGGHRLFMDWSAKEWTSRLYNTKVEVDYKHSFKQMDLYLGGNFRSQVFTYMPSEIMIGGPIESGVYPQRQTLADGHLGFASTDKEMPVGFSAEVGMNYFKINHETLELGVGNETNLYAKGDVWKRLNEENRFGLKVKFDNYDYSINKGNGAGIDNASAIDLNPYYSMENERWRIRLGANIDWWGGDDDKLYLSPDVHAEYVFAGNYVVYAQAVGGRCTHSFYELSSQFSPYWLTDRLISTYTTLDAAIGLKASPANGWWFNLTGGYRISENDLNPYLNFDGRSSYTALAQGKSNVLYGRAELEYNYKDLWNVYLKGTYYHWDWKELYDSQDIGKENNFMELVGLMPEVEVSAGVGAKVMEGLQVNVGYDYVKRTNEIYEPVSNLHLDATYALIKDLQVYGKINNLLGKEYVRPDGYPAQGFNFLAGISFQF